MSAIFEDLEIDYEIMMTDTETFWGQVEAAAERLKSILKKDNSVDNFLKSVEGEPFDFSEQLTALYEHADNNVPIGALKTMAEKLRKLARDLEFLAREKAMLEIADDQEMDKSLAFDLYKDLRDKTNTIVDAWNILKIPNKAEKLASMPGNYGSANQELIKYVFVFQEEASDGIPYREFTAVVRKLEKLGHVIPEMKNKMDLVDYLRANPALGVTVSEQRK